MGYVRIHCILLININIAHCTPPNIIYISIDIDNEKQHATCVNMKLKIDTVCACIAECFPVCSCLSGTLVDGTVVPVADRVYWFTRSLGSRHQQVTGI